MTKYQVIVWDNSGARDAFGSTDHWRRNFKNHWSRLAVADPCV